MASSSLSQEDVDHDLEVQCSRRSRIRTARAVTRTAAPLAVRDLSAPDCELGSLALECDHDASPKPRAKDKRCPRPNHANKCKAQRERRKLREKRRSTGVVHLQSTEVCGSLVTRALAECVREKKKKNECRSFSHAAIS